MDPKVQAAVAACASFSFITLIFFILFILCRKPKPRTRPTLQDSATSLTSIGISASFDPSVDRISMPDLLTATRNFSPDGIVGDGSFGLVYKACLSNGVTVAVKKLSKDAFQGFREFRAEMETLGKYQIRHRNLVRILGYCVSGEDRVLIYEFMENGSLDQWIHDHDHDQSNVRAPLDWETRIKIIKGVANGLFFLHNLDTPIIHRDIKASNVLLDSKFEAHIADFGLARRIQMSHTHVSTQVAGTMGYMPPEYRDGIAAATVQGDVYSFGILMIEVATGKRPNWPIKMDNGKEVGLVEWAHKMAAQNRQSEIIDSSICKEKVTEFGVGEFIRIACLCTSDAWKDRPSMGEVVRALNLL